MSPRKTSKLPDLIETLEELMLLPGPTGQEEPVLAWCREHWAALGAEISVTPVGNVLGSRKADGPRLLIQGHADEIGFVVRSIDKRGFIWLADGQAGTRKFGSRYPVGQPALIVSGDIRVPGIFAAPTGHIMSTRSESPELDATQLFVDIGAHSEADVVGRGVHPGAGVIWNPRVTRLGGRIVGKAIDDRVALALMTHLLHSLKDKQVPYDLTVAATVQEEIGLVGATSLNQEGPFDLAIAIDNGPIADYPGVDRGEIPADLGAGPLLVYKDSWAHYDRRVIEQLANVADGAGIPYQRVVFPGFGSDGAALIRMGIPAALLGIATRYTHSAFEMADVADIEGALKLLIAFVSSDPVPLPPGPK